MRRAISAVASPPRPRSRVSSAASDGGRMNTLDHVAAAAPRAAGGGPASRCRTPRPARRAAPPPPARAACRSCWPNTVAHSSIAPCATMAANASGRAEMVVDAVLLAGSRRAGGGADRQAQLGLGRQQRPGDAALAGAGRAPRRPGRRRAGGTARSLDILHLLAHLLDHRLEPQPGGGQRHRGRLAAQRVGLAHELLHQEVEPAPDRARPRPAARGRPRYGRRAGPAPRARRSGWRAAPPPARSAPAAGRAGRAAGPAGSPSCGRAAARGWSAACSAAGRAQRGDLVELRARAARRSRAPSACRAATRPASAAVKPGADGGRAAPG